MRFVLSLLFASLLVTSVAAQQHGHENEKGPNGGPMMDVAGVHAELIASGTTLTFNLFGEDGKPVDTNGASGSVLVVMGTNRETAQLKPTGKNSLQAEIKKAVGPGAQITVTLKTAAGRSGQVRFKP
jgi:hypothetical protein